MLIQFVCFLLCGCVFMECAFAADVIEIPDSFIREHRASKGGLHRSKRDSIDVIDDDTKQFILQFHNDARQNVFPPASNMHVMEWDDELAGHAETQASACTIENAISAELDVLIIWDSLPASESVLLDFLRQSINESVEAFDYENSECPSPCGVEYLKAILAENNRIGCVFSTCDTFDQVTTSTANVRMLTCVYPVDIIYGEWDGGITSLYEAGYPCSNCGAEYPVCDAYYSLCPNQVPARLELVVPPGPSGNPAGQPFAVQPQLVLYDENDEPYIGLANPSCPWYVGVVFSYGSNPYGVIIGKREVPVVNGTAVFEDLGINEFGEYELYFFVSLPDLHEPGNFLVSSDTIMIGMPLETDGECTVREGDPRFERSYEWSADCSSVCIADCDGNHEKCVDLDGCGPHAECVDSECVCNEIRDFEFDIFEESNLAMTINPVVYCMPDYIEIRLDKCGMNAMGYTLSDLYILGNDGIHIEIDHHYNIDKQLWPYIESCAYNDCRGTVTADENGVVYGMKVRGNFGDCNGEVDSNATHITYTHLVRGYGGWTNGIISRKRPIEIEFSCSYRRRIQATSDNYVNPFIETVSLSLSSESEFNVNIRMMTDSTYEIAFTSPPTITVGDDVYIEIFLSDVDTEGMILFADRCYATPSEDPEDLNYVDLILSGCARSDDMPNVTVAENGEDEFVLFTFESFLFPGHDTLYVHCDVNICLMAEPSCMASCVSRRRRSSGGNSNSVSTTVSLGPISIQDNKRRKKRSTHSRLYSSSFTSKYSTMELANPPFARTTGVGSYALSFA